MAKLLSSLGIEHQRRILKLFHCGIVWGGKGFFRASLYVWYLQYWALCVDLVVFMIGAFIVIYFSLKNMIHLLSFFLLLLARSHAII